jgi:hypothetical protein
MEDRNVDHVAIGPRAVLAIETKFVGAGRQWTTDRYRDAAMDGAVQGQVSALDSALSGCQGPARGARLDALGTGAAQLEDDWALVDGVHVVRGASAADAWRCQCSGGEISPSQAMTIEGILKGTEPCVTPTAHHDDYALRRDDSPRATAPETSRCLTQNATSKAAK